MTAPVRPKSRIDPLGYAKLRRAGFSHTDILSEYDVDEGGADLAGSVLQGVTPLGTWTDEAMGAVKGVGKWAADKLRGKPTGLGQAVSEEMRNEERRSTQLPGVSIASGIASGGAAIKAAPNALKSVLGGAPTSTAGNTFANWAIRAGKGIAAGAAGGAITGAGADSDNRLMGAAKGTAFGAVAGAIPPLIEGAKNTARVVNSHIEGRSPRVRALRDLDYTLQSDRKQIGLPDQEGTVADVSGRYTRKLFGDAIAVPSESGTDFAAQMSAREAGRQGRIDQALTEKSGLLGESPEVTKRMIDETTRPNIKSAYRAAIKSNKALDSDELRDILMSDDPAVRKAMAGAANKMKERRIPKARKPFLTDGSEVAMWQDAEFNAPFVDYTKRGLDAQITSAIKQGRLDDAAAISITRKRLVDEADRLIPGYAEARATDEGRRALINAMELGRRLGKGTVDVRDANAMLQKITPKSSDYADPEIVQQMFKRGVADGIRRRLGKAQGGVGAIQAITGNENAKEVTRLAFPDDAAFQAFEKSLADELAQLPAEALSKGAQIHPAFESTDAFGALSPWAVGQALKGNPQLAIAQGAGTLLRQNEAGINRASASYLADLARQPASSQTAAEAAKDMARIRQMPRINRMAAQSAKRRAESYRPAFTEMARILIRSNSNNDR